MSAELKKISDLTAGTPADTDIIPYVDLTAGATKKALKSELKGDTGATGAAATADAGTTTTLAAGASATVVNSGSTSEAVFDFGIPQGIAGDDGACVESVAFVGNDMVFTLDDASTVTLTDAKLDLKGDTGATGAVIESAAFVGDDLVFTLSDASTVTLTGALTSLKGDTGDTGATGAIGVDWQGDWSAGTYTVTQGVSHNGSSWIATTTTTEEPSALATDWDIIALKGTDGAGSGDVTGPDGATNNNIAVFDGVTGKLIKDGGATIASKQDALGYTAENSANKENSTIDTSTTKYPTVNLLKTVNDSIPTKATGSELDTGTNDTLFATSKAIKDSKNVPSVAPGTSGNVLTSDGTDWTSAAPAGGSSFWTAVPGSPTRTGNTTFTITDTGNANEYDKLISRGTCLKWTETSTLKQAMVVSATYATDTVTVTIMGDTMASIDADSLKYFAEKARVYKWAIAGTIGATGTNLGNTVMCDLPGKIFGADIWAGTAGNGTTTVDINKGGTSMFTTKPSITTTNQSDLGNTADSETTTATGDFLTIDVDAVAATTKIVDLYVNLYYIPLYNSYLE